MGYLSFFFVSVVTLVGTGWFKRSFVHEYDSLSRFRNSSVNVFMQFFAWPFCAFLLELSLTSQVTFSRFRSSFLSDLYYSHSEVKLFSKIKSIAALQEEGLDSRVGSASDQGAGGQWFEFQRTKHTPKKFI